MVHTIERQKYLYDASVPDITETHSPRDIYFPSSLHSIAFANQNLNWRIAFLEQPQQIIRRSLRISHDINPNLPETPGQSIKRRRGAMRASPGKLKEPSHLSN